jgi:hypothetical protein
VRATGVTAVVPPAADLHDAEDRRWRILEVTGHGVDVWNRHVQGMKLLKEVEDKPGMPAPDGCNLLENVF